MTTSPPRGAGKAGRRLWRAVVDAFDLDEHELVLLRQAVHVADQCDQLQAIVDTDGPMVNDRIHPALVELRQSRIVLARLIVALRVPLGETTDEEPARTQFRGTRGFYSIRGDVA